MVLSLLDSFAGFAILKLFLFNPRASFNINEVAKNSKFSVFPAKTYCDEFLKDGLLVVENVGNQRRFSLNNESPYVKELKKTFALLWFKDLGIDKLVKDTAYSFSIYGSFANGEFDDNSDLDLLVIGQKQDVDFLLLSKFEKEINREIQLTIYNWVEWRKMEKAKEVFVTEVQKKHILLWGSKV
jgi:predicted nucleotidyltransferase